MIANILIKGSAFIRSFLFLGISFYNQANRGPAIPLYGLRSKRAEQSVYRAKVRLDSILYYYTIPTYTDANFSTPQKRIFLQNLCVLF